MGSSFSRKIALAVQIAAMLLVQFYSLVPSLSLAFFSQEAGHKRSGLCRGNHVECGCAPERIASHTCCCYRQKQSCCDLSNQRDAQKAGQQNSDTSALPRLCTAPCGSSANFITASVQQLKFVLPETHVATISGSFFLLAFPVEETASGRVAEPPDPPPKLVFPS